MYPGWVYDCEIRYSQNNQIPWIPPGARVAGMHEFPKVGVQKQTGVFLAKSYFTIELSLYTRSTIYNEILSLFYGFYYHKILHEKLYEKI